MLDACECFGLLFVSFVPCGRITNGIPQALKLFQNKAFTCIVEKDSLQVIQALQNTSLNLSPYGQIVEDGRSVLCTRRSWVASHVKREANSAAHLLAKDALQNSHNRVWMEEDPICIISVLSLEQLALVP